MKRLYHARDPEGNQGKPKIVIVTPLYPTALHQVAGIFVMNFADSLRRDFEVTVIHIEGNVKPILLQKFKSLVLKVTGRRDPARNEIHRSSARAPDYTLYQTRRFFLGRSLFLGLMQWRLKRLIMKGKPADLVMAWTAWPTGYAAWKACVASGLHRVAVLEISGPLSNVVRDDFVRERLRALFRSRSTIPLAISPFMEAEMRKHLGLPDLKCAYAGCVIADPYFQLPLARPARIDSPIRILCVGMIHRSKGQHLLIEAAAAMRAQSRLPFEIICAGMGPDLEEFAKLSEERGLTGCIRFPGPVSEAEKLTLLAESHFFVTPTFHDTLGIVIIEAMAAGLPVVSTKNGAADWMIDESIGIICSTDDVESLTLAVIRMMNSYQDYDRRAIRERVRAVFSTKASVAQFRTATGM